MSQEKGEILARAGCKIGLFVVEFFLCRLSSVVEHVHGKATVLQLRLQWREVPYISNITGLCRLSSVVEHVHGKDGVVGSNPTDGSI